MESDLKFIVEANIPFVKGLLEPYGRVVYLRPEEITAEAMADCDGLITRTRTRCDAELLHGSRCSMIATATIGLDHIDLDYCRKNGIEVANAPGCNAPAVAQYVLATIIAAHGGPENVASLRGKRLGIVGVGHVGSIVDRWARQLGMTTLLCDPPRAEREGRDKFTTLDTIAREADIITFHTPYTKSGAHATHHLADRNFFESLRRKPMIINSARGPIVDNAALVEAIDGRMVDRVAIDCWENEPEINRQLLEKAFVATPHIAGYSREGKVRATQMAVAALARHFRFPTPLMDQRVASGAKERVTAEMIAASYSPLADTEALRTVPGSFEALRNNYDLRREV